MRKIYVFALVRANEESLTSPIQTAIFRTMDEAKDEIRRLMNELKEEDDEWGGYVQYESESRLEYYAYCGSYSEMRVTIQEYRFTEG